MPAFHIPKIHPDGEDRYASEVDVDFVRKSIKAIGQTAIKIEAGAERCVNVLLELIGPRVSYVVQEAVVVMKVPVPFILY